MSPVTVLSRRCPFGVVGSLALVALLLVACGGQPSAGNPPAGGRGASSQAASIRGGEQPDGGTTAVTPLTPFRFVFTGENFSSLPFHIAQTQGLYRKYGL